MDRISFCSAIPLICASLVFAYDQTDGTILRDNLPDGDIAVQQAFVKSSGAEERSL